MSGQPSYQDRIVAFIDILGFGVLVSSLTEQPELHERLFYALTHIKSYKMTSQMENTAHSDLEVSVFSDSIAMSADKHNFNGIIWASGWLHAQLLGSGILTRGGISIGKTVHTDDILYGEGMLKAYKIESSAAVYPRIVVDPALIDQIKGPTKYVFLKKDSDGLWFVDPFCFDPIVEGASELAADGYDPHEIYLDKLGKHIENGIGHAKQVDHLSKWTWLKLRHEAAREDYLRKRGTKLSSLRKLAEHANAVDR